MKGSSYNSSIGQLAVVGLVAFIYLFFSLNDYLFFPPVWDAAAGLFAPAIYLFENNGNYFSLLEQSGYQHGGPNVHSLSLFTLITYGVIRVLGANVDLYLPVLHSVQIVFSALIVVLTWYIARSIASLLVAIAGVLVLIFTPFFLVQASYVYTEIPGALLALCCLVSWANQRFVIATIFALLALLLKQTGLFVVVSFLFLLVNEKGFLKKYNLLAIAVMLVVGSAAWLFLIHGGNAPEPPVHNNYTAYFRQLVNNLSYVPDLYFWVLLFIVLLVFNLVNRKLLFPISSKEKIFLDLDCDTRARLNIGAIFFVGAFLSLMATVYIAGNNFFPVPRYYVWVLPLLIVLGISFIRDVLAVIFEKVDMPSFSKLFVQCALVLLAVIYLQTNKDGELYPASNQAFSSFSIAERSFEYVNYYSVQKQTLEELAENYSEWPTYVTRGEYYFASSLLMGYVSKLPTDMRFIFDYPEHATDVSLLPRKFVLVDANSNGYHGKGLLVGLANMAINSGYYSVEELRVTSEPYYGRLLVFERYVSE